MDSERYYESARQFVDSLIDDSFGRLTKEENRKLARVWQYLRDQEIAAIQRSIRSQAAFRELPTTAKFGRSTFVASSAG